MDGCRYQFDTSNKKARCGQAQELYWISVVGYVLRLFGVRKVRKMNYLRLRERGMQ